MVRTKQTVRLTRNARRRIEGAAGDVLLRVNPKHDLARAEDDDDAQVSETREANSIFPFSQYPCDNCVPVLRALTGRSHCIASPVQCSSPCRLGSRLAAGE